jgi:hypothetical protein
LVADSRTRIVPLIVDTGIVWAASGPKTYWRERNVEFAAVALCAWVLLVIADEMRVATPAIRSAPVVSVQVPKAGVIGAAPVWGR